jgi:hypothetical protein
VSTKFTFNPFLGNFDEVSVDVEVVASDPTTGQEGVFYMVSGDPTKVWYFLGGNRYYMTGTLDNPIGGRTYGILLAIPIT